MNLEINKKEYKTIIKSLYWASTVLKSFRPGMEDKEVNQDKLLKKLLPEAGQFEMWHWIKKDKKGQTILREEKEFDLYEVVEEFEILAFWNNLAQRLAQRDLEEVLSDEDILSMTLGDELDKEYEIQQKYEEEFVENGLQNIRLIHPDLN